MFFKHDNESRKLPRSVNEYMQHRFILLPGYLDVLRCFEYEGVVNGKEVRCIRIFSPHRARERHLSIRSRLDLEQHPDMLLFEGYIDRRGSVYVADRRPPLRQVRVKQGSLQT